MANSKKPKFKETVYNYLGEGKERERKKKAMEEQAYVDMIREQAIIRKKKAAYDAAKPTTKKKSTRSASK